MIKKRKNLCKKCDTCQDYTYNRVNKYGNVETFQYCKGGKKEANQSEWYIQNNGYVYSTRPIKGYKRQYYHHLFKEEPQAHIEHIRGNKKDNRLRMLRQTITKQYKPRLTKYQKQQEKKKQTKLEQYIKGGNKTI